MHRAIHFRQSMALETRTFSSRRKFLLSYKAGWDSALAEVEWGRRVILTGNVKQKIIMTSFFQFFIFRQHVSKAGLESWFRIKDGWGQIWFKIPYALIYSQSSQQVVQRLSAGGGGSDSPLPSLGLLEVHWKMSASAALGVEMSVRTESLKIVASMLFSKRNNSCIASASLHEPGSSECPCTCPWCTCARVFRSIDLEAEVSWEKIWLNSTLNYFPVCYTNLHSPAVHEMSLQKALPAWWVWHLIMDSIYNFQH